VTNVSALAAMRDILPLMSFPMLRFISVHTRHETKTQTLSAEQNLKATASYSSAEMSF